MVEEEILEVEQEVRGLDAMEQEAKALEEADAKAVAEARKKRKLRKKKVLRRKLLIFLFIFLTAALGIGAYLYRKHQKEAAANAAVEITAEEGQQLLYAKITQIQGNEITFEETDPNISGTSTENSLRLPADSSPEMPGEIPLNPSDESSSEFPGGNSFNPPADSSFESPDKSLMDPPAETSSESPGKIRTMQIPVGTDVITMLGAVTTFSRLNADDTIAIVLEEDEIIRIYLIR